MSNFLVFVLILLYSFQSGFCGLYSRHYPGGRYSSDVYSVLYGAIVALVTAISVGFSLSPSPITLALGVLTGALLVLYNAMLITASSSGPYSVTMIFNLSGGILVPMVWSIAVDGMRLSLLQYAAIGLMLVAFVFLNWEEKQPESKLSPKFLVCAVTLFLTNGFYGTLMNLQKTLTNDSENSEMIFVAFLSSSLMALVMLAVRAKKETLPSFKQTKKSALFLGLASISAATAVNLMMHILSLVNVAVLYTMDNGGVLLISALWSAIFMKEKLGKMKIVGLALAIISVFALGFLQNA